MDQHDNVVMRSTRTRQGGTDARCLRSAAAFTLIETLVVVSTIGLLLSILLPALSSARDTAKTLVCATNVRSVTSEFTYFAEDHGGRRFHVNEFQNRMYKLDEYWDLGDRSSGAVAGDADVMLCPAGRPELVKLRNRPCGSRAFSNETVGNVTLAVNMRLYRGVVKFKGQKMMASTSSTHISSRTLQHPYAPLILDVDGEEAMRRKLEPFYAAPPVADESDPFADGRHWFPSSRHRGKVNVGFLGGHVLGSTQPEKQHWDWTHQGDVGR